MRYHATSAGQRSAERQATSGAMQPLEVVVYAIVGLVVSVASIQAASAQEGRAASISAEVAKAREAQAMAEAQARQASGQSPNPRPEQQNKPEKSGGKQGEDKDAGNAEKPKDDTAPATVTRPQVPGFTVDPSELDIEPDADGKIEFSFHGQPWLEVLNWLAGVSGLSLDWQELPGDYLNLTTHRKYSLDEMRDLVNRHLLSRGYTLILEGEVLHVVKMEKLNPSMVQHVPPHELETLLPSTVVKTTFDLPQDLVAEQAVEDVKQLLSEHGKNKVQALKATNRIFVIDQVANLLDVRRMISDERQELEGHTVPRTFVLRHARATDVVQTLEELLGMQSSGAPAAAVNPNQMRQMMQQMQKQMQKQMQQMKKQQGGGAGVQVDDKVYLVAVPRHNIILANAPPHKMEIIEATIEVLDVEMRGGESLLGNMHRMSQYRLVSLDPEIVVNTLREIGNLDPKTRLQADTASRSIMAYATLADHVTIKTLLDKLDGAGREFKVIRLRRLPADQVAGTIEYMMGGQDAEEDQNNRRSIYYYPYYGRQQEEDGPKDKFRVEADVERNWLLLWANESELEEVDKFLVQMGELPSGSIAQQTVRLLDVSRGDDTDALLERLERAWGGRSELIIEDNRPPEEETQPTIEADAGEDEARSKEDDVLLPEEDRQTRLDSRDNYSARRS